MEVVEKHKKYLGLPSVVGKSNKEVFAHIRDKVCRRLQGWKEKWLSKASKEIMIKSIVHAIPTFEISCFKLRGYFMKEFWWENSQGRGMHWVRWQELCKSKHFGGLGFRDLEAFHMALLAKQLWRLLENPNGLLSRIYKARYFPNTDVFGSSLGSNPSHTWRSIWSAKKSYLIRGLAGGLEMGLSGCLENILSNLLPKGENPENMKVSALIDKEVGLWKVDLFKKMFLEDDSKTILSLSLGSIRNEDRIIWYFNRNKMFFVRSAYKLDKEAKEAVNDSSR